MNCINSQRLQETWGSEKFCTSLGSEVAGDKEASKPSIKIQTKTGGKAEAFSAQKRKKEKIPLS